MAAVVELEAVRAIEQVYEVVGAEKHLPASLLAVRGEEHTTTLVPKNCQVHLFVLLVSV